MPRRGLQSVRTQSSRRATAALQTPELYIRLTSLEMERSRRMLERERLLERVQILDERLVELVREQDEMRARIDRLQTDPSAHPGSPAKDSQDFGFKY